MSFWKFGRRKESVFNEDLEGGEWKMYSHDGLGKGVVVKDDIDGQQLVSVGVSKHLLDIPDSDLIDKKVKIKTRIIEKKGAQTIYGPKAVELIQPQLDE